MLYLIPQSKRTNSIKLLISKHMQTKANMNSEVSTIEKGGLPCT